MVPAPLEASSSGCACTVSRLSGGVDIRTATLSGGPIFPTSFRSRLLLLVVGLADRSLGVRPGTVLGARAGIGRVVLDRREGPHLDPADIPQPTRAEAFPGESLLVDELFMDCVGDDDRGGSRDLDQPAGQVHHRAEVVTVARCLLYT